MSAQLPTEIVPTEGYFRIQVATVSDDLTRIATVINAAIKKLNICKRRLKEHRLK